MSGDMQKGSSYAQTLGRGLRVLEVLAASSQPLSLPELSSRLAVHRSVAYRLVRTLIDHGLVQPLPDGRYGPGLGLVTLARAVGTDVRAVAHPVLTAASERLNATVILAVADGDEAVCLISVEPQASGLRVTYREGLRHPLHRGASGLAILSARPPQAGERAAVQAARVAGCAVSNSELETDTLAISAPVRLPGRPCQSAVTALFAASSQPDEKTAVDEVMSAAQTIAGSLGQGHRFF